MNADVCISFFVVWRPLSVNGLFSDSGRAVVIENL